MPASAAPHAGISYSPAAPETGQPVEFSDTSTDDTGSIEVREWYVDGEYLGGESTLTHVFESSGSHEVTLSVYDDNEDEDTTTAVVSVAQAPSERLETGNVEARLYYTTSEESFQPVKLQVLRAGQVVYDRNIRPRCGGDCPVIPTGAYGGSPPSLQSADFDRDGEPELVFNVAWGNICCRATTVLAFDQATGGYAQQMHNWGNSSPGPLRDLGHGGGPVWRSSDGRIRYVFGCGGCVPYPVRVVAYRGGGFVDVTRSYPDVVRADARRMWRLYRRRSGQVARGALAAWAADQYSLGRKRRVWRAVRAARRAGRLRRDGEFDLWPHDARYAPALRRWLRRAGYG